MTINYLEGDATQPIADGPKIIVHVCNDIGGWGKGFVVAISKRWKEPEAAYRSWYKEDGDQPFELGEVQFVIAEDGLWIANLIGQHGIRRKGSESPVRYEAIGRGLETVGEFAAEHSASVHMPRIGCGLAGGQWKEIEPLIEEALLEKKIDVYVYDFA